MYFCSAKQVQNTMGRKRQNQPYKLREKKNSKGQTISYYLDFYDGNVRQKRKIDDIKPYLDPKTPAQKAYNDTCRLQAQKAAAEANADYLAGKHGYIKGQTKKEAKVLFSEYIAQLAEEKDISQGTKKSYFLAANHVKKCDLPLCKITPLWVESFLKQLKAAGIAESSQSLYYTKVKTALRTAARKKLISHNPCEEIEPSQTPKLKGARKIEYLTKEEVQSLIDTPTKYEAVRAAFLFGCFCGLRFSDIMRLKWEHIEEKNGFLYVRITQKKTSEPLEIPLSTTARKYLPARKQVNPYVFNQIDSDTANMNLRKWAKAAGINKYLHFHVSRHTFAVHFLSYAKGQIYELQKLLGHKNLTTTQRYADLVDQAKEEAIKQMPEY